MIHTWINGEEGVFLKGRWISRFNENGREVAGIACENIAGEEWGEMLTMPWFTPHVFEAIMEGK